MATWLFAWELGGGWGHVAPFRRPIEQLLRRGHKVVFAARDVAPLPGLLRGLEVRWFQSPQSVASITPRINPARTYAELLHNVGWGDADELAALVSAWRNLFDAVRPDALVLDHAPTALLAARGTGLRTVLTGTGFVSPPGVDPLPRLLEETNDANRSEVEPRVLLHARQCCEPAWALASLGQLYGQADATLLLTYPDLDHFPGRQNGSYFGVWDYGGPAVEPDWPPGERRVFGYWKPFPGEEALAAGLSERGLSSLLVRAEPAPFPADKLARFVTQPVRIQSAARQAALAIVHGSFHTTAALLRQGVPMLLIPLTVEQWLLAQRIAALGAGLLAPFDQPAELLSRLDAMLATDSFARAAQAAAARLGPIDDDQAVANYVDALERVLR